MPVIVLKKYFIAYIYEDQEEQKENRSTECVCVMQCTSHRGRDAKTKKKMKTTKIKVAGEVEAR